MKVRAVMHRRTDENKTGWKKAHGKAAGGGPKEFHFPRTEEAARGATLAEAVAHLARYLHSRPEFARHVERIKVTVPESALR